MAALLTAKTEDEVRKTTVGQLRKDYNKLADIYTKLTEGKYMYCHCCGKFKSNYTFYESENYASGFFPICKDCLLKIAEQRKEDRDPANETKESVQKVLQMMDLPYNDALYESCRKKCADKTSERAYGAPFTVMLTQLKTLPQWRNKTWKDSDFGYTNETENGILEDTKKNKQIIKAGKKRFGSGYTIEELYWLENEYQDWIARYPCGSKGQEVLFRQLCCQELEQDQMRLAGKNTKDIAHSIQETMSSLGIKPSQSNVDAMIDSLSFGQLIDRWEHEKPIPKPDPELEDIDKIGMLIDVFYKGHLAKSLGIKGAFSQLYDRFMEKYTVHKPVQNDEEQETLFNKIFGSKVDEEVNGDP